MAESRKIALDTLEKKMRTEKLLGKGGRLGGAVPDMKGKRMSDIMADVSLNLGCLFLTRRSGF